MSALERLTGRLTRGQHLAEQTMTLTLSAYSPDVATKTSTGMATPQFKLEGQCAGKVQSRTQQGDVRPRTVKVGGVDFPVIEGGLHIPMGAFLAEDQDLRIRPGWQFVVDVVGPPADPALTGNRYQVVDGPEKSFATARRLNVFEVRKVAT